MIDPISARVFSFRPVAMSAVRNFVRNLVIAILAVNARKSW